jgi:hypothetical protein
MLESDQSMKTSRNTEITIETHLKRIVRVSRSQTSAMVCDICGAKVTYFSVSRAATLLGLSETAIFRLAESGQVHSFENESGSLLICGESLLAIDSEISTQLERTNLISGFETNEED